jgi:hypothetical protein
MLAFLRRCGHLTVAPGETAEVIVLSRAHLGGFLLGWVGALPGVLWVGEALWPNWNWIPGYLLAGLLAAVVQLLIQASVFHLLGKLLGGRGRWDTMVALCGYAAVPFLTWALLVGGGLAVYVRLLGPLHFHLAGFLLFLLSLLVVIVAALVILRHGVGSNYGLSGGRAWLATLAGALVLLLSGGLLSGKFVARCSVTSANLQAVSLTPVPLAAEPGEDGLRLSIEYRANRRYYREVPIRRGDLVLVRGNDGRDWIGRILGLPGEEAGVEQGRLVIGGQPWPETWRIRGTLTIPARRLGPNEYFFWTDDRTAGLRLALSSEFPGAVQREQILGPPLRVYSIPMRWWLGEPPQ